MRNKGSTDGPPVWAKHTNGPDQPVERATGVAVANHATAPPYLTEGGDERERVDEIANALQAASVLATRSLEPRTGGQDAVDLEGATDRAVRAMKRLRSTKHTK